MWLNLYGRQVVLSEFKKGLKQKNAFLALFWAYIGVPDSHIGWATLMPLASIYPTKPKTNPWKFSKKILRIGEVE